MRALLLLYCLLPTTMFAEDVDTPAADLPDKAPMLTLGKVDAESTEEATSINIRFSNQLDWETVSLSDHGSFIQIEMPNTIVPNPGDFFDGAGDLVKKMAVFQITPQTAALRLFVSDDALLVKQSLKADILGDRVLVTIDHANLAALVASDPKVTAAPPNAKTADEVIAATTVDANLPEPASQIKSQAEPAAIDQPTLATQTSQAHGEPSSPAGASVFNFQDKLLKVAAFFGVLLLGLLIFLLAAPRIRKAKLALAPKPDVAMRSLASHIVAPKQKLELIDVGGQQILIGVTPGNINFLTTIAPKPSNMTVAQPNLQPKKIANPIPRQITPPSNLTQTPAQSSRPVGPIPAAYAAAKPKAKQNDAINDVTKLIREKLKNIPSV